MSLDAGVRLGPYELVDLLGAGGMGEVYRARDTRLDRIVAIKVLPRELAAAPDRRQRFEREARAIASLNHPHICTLYEFDRAPGADGSDVDFLVMEHLDGETLAARLQRVVPKGLPLADVLGIAIQVAEALAVAHRQGVVHRDLKPGNVMLVSGGGAGDAGPQVKLLDFGLAKLAPTADRDDAPVSEATATASGPLTGEGALLGTVPYMAPEQLEGKEADARTDLFALGAIVYEMVTGHRAFESDSEAGLIAAILEHEPVPLCERAPLAPPALERVVRECLSKDPDERWESAHDLADELRWILQDSGTRDVVRPPPLRRRRRSALVAAAAGVAAIALGALAVRQWSSWFPPLPPMRTIPLTTYPGDERDPAISPDGERVAFTWRGPTGEGPFKLYVKLVEGGEALLIHEGSDDVYTPAWSPDGRQIAFIRHVPAGAVDPSDGLFVVPALGSAARQLGVFRRQHGLAWTPDGTQIALSHAEAEGDPSAIYLLSMATGDRRRLTQPPQGYRGDSYPQFSPDGTLLAFQRSRDTYYSEIYVTELRGGDARRLTFNRSNLYGFDWTADGRALVFSAARAGRPTSAGLWRIPIAGGEPRPLEVGELGAAPAIARHAQRLAYEHSPGSSDIWTVRGPAAADEESPPRPLTSSTAADYSPAYSPDGNTVAFSSLRTGYSEIWTVAADGSEPRQLTFLEQYSIAPRWSPDGQRLAFFSAADDTFDVYAVSVSGGVPTRLTNDAWENIAPTWSHDGRSIYFRSNRSGRAELWKMPVEGGTLEQVTHHGAMVAYESPDGRFVYFTKRNIDFVGPPGIWRVPVVGGDEERILTEGFHNVWAIVESGLCYMTFDAGAPPTIKFFDWASGTTRQVAQVPGAGATGMSVSPDGRSIVFTHSKRESDIMVVENFR